MFEAGNADDAVTMQTGKIHDCEGIARTRVIVNAKSQSRKTKRLVLVWTEQRQGEVVSLLPM